MFAASSRAGGAWFFAGLASSFADVDESGSAVLAEQLPCKQNQPSSDSTMSRTTGNCLSLPACRVFGIPRDGGTEASEVVLGDREADGENNGAERSRLEDQVMVFRYKGKFHAVDHVCRQSHL